MNRAYSTIQIKSIDEDQRIIEGIASTPNPDRSEDIVNPLGGEFKLPLPFLMGHGQNGIEDSVGHVISAKATKEGIAIRAKIERDPLLPELDKAWARIKKGLVRGLSIGFRSLGTPTPIKDSFGVRFDKWELLEISGVVIPANMDASILSIKQYDDASRTASGADVVDEKTSYTYSASLNLPPPVVVEVTSPAQTFKVSRAELEANVTSISPGVSGQQVSDVVAAELARALARNSKTQRGKRMKTIQEQIPGYEASRAAKFARMTEIMTKSADEGRSLDEQETDEYDGLDREVKATDAHLTRLRAHEKAMVATAQPVRPTVPGEGVSETKMPVISMGKSNLPKGTGFVRMVQALAATKGARFEAIEFAANRWNDSTPEVARVLKAAMTAGTTTDSDWAEPLVEYRTLASEFIDLLRPATIIGRMPGLRRVPFNIRVAGKTQGATVGWVGQGAPKPVSELKFNEVTLGMAKAAGIVVISQELARSSSPQAEGVIREDLVATMTQFLDEQFVNPAVAAVANVSPASITNGASHFTSTGTTIAQITADMATLFGYFVAGNLAPTSGVFIMSPTTALGLSLKRTSQDVFAFPGLTVNGGTFFGLPVIVSRSIPGSVSGGTIIVLADASEIFLADDGGVRVDVSEQASIQMDSAPSAGAQSLTSLWQNNLVGIRAERFVNWMRRRDAAVAYIDMVPVY